MSVQNDSLTEQDRRQAKSQSAVFWTIGLVLMLGMLAAYPPTVHVSALAGWSVVGSFALATVLYIVRLMVLDTEVGSTELLVAGVVAAATIGVDQWMAGGFRAPFGIIFTLHVLGSAAVMDRRERLLHLAAVSTAVAAPLIYDTASLSAIITVLVMIAILLFEAALLAEFGTRLRGQRAQLHEAEREASARAVTDALTGLGNRRGLEEALEAAARRVAPEDPLTIVYLDLDGFKAYNDRFGHATGDALLQRLGAALDARTGSATHAFRIGGDEFCVLLGGAREVGDPQVVEIIDALSERGSGFVIGPSCGLVCMPRDAQDMDAALRLADQRMYAEKRSGRPSPATEVSRLLVRLLGERDSPVLYDHLDLGSLARGMALRLGLPSEEADVVARAAELRNIGKIAIPDAILHKPGPLDAGERALMCQHTVIAERILTSSTWFASAGRLVRSSPERPDGTGYPDGLSGEQIPMGARIVSACGAYAAMLTERPYRAAMSTESALAELQRCAGTQFDPDVVEALVMERRRLTLRDAA